MTHQLARASLERLSPMQDFDGGGANTPRQRLTEGVAKLEVVESRIGKVAIAGRGVIIRWTTFVRLCLRCERASGEYSLAREEISS